MFDAQKFVNSYLELHSKSLKNAKSQPLIGSLRASASNLTHPDVS